MEKAKWTKEQQDAIYDNGCNLLVAAGAGAGKTAVLVERVIQKLLDENSPIDIDRLLVVTFTNAAASEMRERIGDAISRELEVNPESMNLQRQLALLNRANVMTIHSFCLHVIRNNFHLIDIDPNFRVCDDTEGILLKEEVMEEFFDDYFDSENKEFINLVKAFGEKDDRKVQGIIQGLYRFAVSTPWPMAWLEKIAEDFNVPEDFDFASSKWCSLIIEDFIEELHGCREMLKRAINMLKENLELEIYMEFLKKEEEALNLIIQSNSFESICEGLNNIDFQRFPSKKVEGDGKIIKDKIKEIRDDVKKKVQGISSVVKSFSESKNGIKDMYPLLKTLSSLTIEFSRRFSLKKRDKGIIDFNDIEHLALEILCKEGEPSEIALNYRDYFEEILIDEYQDSNLVQEVIMNMISKKNPGNVFMVGDVKQSIYRFRHAKPELFLNKYNEYKDFIGAPGKKIKLYKNFRSRAEIIDSVNFIFSQLMSVNLGELDYNKEEALEAAAVYSPSENNIEFHIMDVDSIEEEAEEEDVDNIQLEARMVGKRIQEFMDSDSTVFDKELKIDRKIAYKDMVILMRATEKWAQIFAEELSIMKIPVFADTSKGYFDTTEIKTIMSLLQVMDNPFQDIPLLAVMRSPIFSFTAEELIDIRTTDKTISFYEVCISGEIENLELRDKVTNLIEKINLWRNKGQHIPVDEFIWYLYLETAFFSIAGTMTNGVQRQANLRLLFERAREYEKTSYKGLFNFINFVNKLKNSSGDMGSAKILGENENVVRIMSIHKSKGLEFPVVFLCGTGKKFNMMDANQSILFHQDLGYGPDYVDIERRISYPTLVKQIVKRKIKTETLSEELRILYVAFTRARERLIITGLVKDIRKNCEKWCSAVDNENNKLSKYYLSNSKSLIDWLGAAVVRCDGGEVIRELGDLRDNLDAYPSKWKITLWNKYQVISSDLEEKVPSIFEEKKFKVENIDIYNEVKRRLQWEYKYSKLSRVPGKITVSELKMEDKEQVVPLRKPRFLQSTRNLTGAEKGTIIHLVMEHIDLTLVDHNGIKKQLENMVEKEFITEEEAKTVSPTEISKFFNTDLGRRMVSADFIKREAPFFIELKAKDVYPELIEDEYKDETIVLQGVIDCFFEEKGQLVLVDYKTDYVEDLEAIEGKYQKQLELYGEALEKLTGMAVKEKFLYLFSSGNLVKIL